MNKIGKILVVLLIVTLACVMIVWAANTSMKLSPSVTEVKAGDTFTIGIDVQCDTGFEGLTGKLEWDKAKLELVTTSDGNAIKNMNDNDAEGNYIVTLFTNSKDAIKSVTCQTITFKVLDAVNVGDKLNIKLTADMKDGNEKIEGLVAETTLTVASEQEEPPIEGNNTTGDNTVIGNNTTGNNTTSGNNTTGDNTVIGNNTTGDNTVIGNNTTGDNTVTGNNTTGNNTTSGNNTTAKNTTTGNNTTGNNKTNSTTKTNNSVPYTGATENISKAVVVLAIFSIVTFIGYKKYSNF